MRNKLRLKINLNLLAIAIIGTIHDRYPRANPCIMLIAAPDLHDSARFLHGLKLIEMFTHVYLRYNNQ